MRHVELNTMRTLKFSAAALKIPSPRELGAQALDFICSLFSWCGRWCDHSNLFNIKSPPPLEEIFAIIHVFNPALCSLDSPVDRAEKRSHRGLTSLLGSLLPATPPPSSSLRARQRHTAPHPAPRRSRGTSCVVEVVVASLICGALRVRSGLRPSPRHLVEVTHLISAPFLN